MIREVENGVSMMSGRCRCVFSGMLDPGLTLKRFISILYELLHILMSPLKYNII